MIKEVIKPGFFVLFFQSFEDTYIFCEVSIPSGNCFSLLHPCGCHESSYVMIGSYLLGSEPFPTKLCGLEMMRTLIQGVFFYLSNGNM